MRDLSRYVLVVDIDGTINEMGPRFDDERIDNVKPMAIAREILKKFEEGGAIIIYLTGRQETKHGRSTSEWLANHGFPLHDPVLYYDASLGNWTWNRYLRFKKRRLEETRVMFPGKEIIVIDDNPSVVRTASAMGFRAFQVKSSVDWEKITTRLLLR